MTNDHYDQKYTDPELRRRLKDEIMQSDKGGDRGHWSARKSQLLVQEYEKHGGGYQQAEKDEAAKSLEEWTEQDWQTEDGDANAHEQGVTKRYLPKAAWEKLSDDEKQEAEQTKEAASKHGDQRAEWTPAIKRAMHTLETDTDRPSPKVSNQELYEQAKALHISGRSKMNREELEQAIAEANPDR